MNNAMDAHALKSSYEDMCRSANALAELKTKIDTSFFRVSSFGRELDEVVEKLSRTPRNEWSRDDLRLVFFRKVKERSTLLAASIPLLLTAVRNSRHVCSASINVVEYHSLMRTLIENICMMEFIQKKMRGSSKKILLNNFDDFMNCYQHIRQYSLAMSFNWRELLASGSFLDIIHDKRWRPDASDWIYEKTNIMTIVENVGKNLSGLTSYYSFLCDFVHPNYGNQFSSLLGVKIEEVRSFSFLRRNRELNLEKTLFDICHESNLPEEDASFLILSMSLKQSYYLLENFRSITSNFIDIIHRMELLWSRDLHKNLKKHKIIFDAGEKCPCGSGIAFKQCLKMPRRKIN